MIGGAARLAALVLAATGCLDSPPSALTADGAPSDGAPSVLLLAAYPFDSPDELADSSGNGLDASCTACPAWIPDRNDANEAALFDGVDDLVLLPAIGTGAFTVMSWVRVDSDPGHFHCAINRPNAAIPPHDSYQLCLQVVSESVERLHFYTTDAPVELGAEVSMSLGSWHHVAIRWDGSEKTIWFDGALVATGEGTTQYDDSGVRLGSDLDSGAVVATFNGALDQLEVWQGALSGDAILAAASQ